MGRSAAATAAAAAAIWRGVSAAGRLPSGEGDAVGVGEVELGLLHVARDVDEHRAAAAGARDVERGLEDVRQLVDVLHEPRMLDDRDRDAGDVALLERVGADQERPHLARDADERRRVHPRVGDRRDEVRRAGPGGRDRDADAAGGARVALGHVAGALLVPREHVAHGGAARHRVVERQDRAARQPEHHVDALRLERAEDRVCAVHLHAAPAQGCESWKPETTRDVNSRDVAPTPRAQQVGRLRPVDEHRRDRAGERRAGGRSVEPVLEHHRGGEQHAARVDDAAAGEREAAVGRRHEDARPVLREQPVRRDARASPVRRRSRPSPPPTRDATSATSKRLALNAASGIASFGARCSTLHVLVVRRDRVDEIVPRTHRRLPRCASCATRRSGTRLSIVHSSASGCERRDERDVVALPEPHARDLCAQVELAHDLRERGLLGTGHEHRVGREDRRARQRGHRLAGTRDRDAAERDVRLVDLQSVQARDRVEREHRLRHQLRRRSGSGHTCDFRRTAHAATSLEDVFERDRAAGVGPLLEAAECRVELFTFEARHRAPRTHAQTRDGPSACRAEASCARRRRSDS